MWSYLFYGMFFYIHVVGKFNWQALDDLRYANQNS